MVWIVLLVCGGLILSGCGGPTGTHYSPGRVFVIDNTRPPQILGTHGNIVRTWIEYDERFYYIDTGLPRNMNQNGICNCDEPIELTDAALPGGTPVKVKYWFDHMNSTIEFREITFTVDGDITVELYMDNWLYSPSSMVNARIHKGRWTGPDPAAPVGSELELST